jgi:hypothetical protein
MKKLLAISLLLLLNTTAKADGYVPYLVLNSSVIRSVEAVNQVISSQAQWKSFYKKHSFGILNPTIPVLPVNFNKQQVIVIASGAKGTGGYTTLVANVYDIDNTLVINGLVINPASGCAVIQQVTYPAAIIAVPKTKKPLQFNISNVLEQCN